MRRVQGHTIVHVLTGHFDENELLWESWSWSHYHLKYRAALPHGNVWTPVPRVLSSLTQVCSSRAYALSAFMGDSHQHLTPRRHPTPVNPTHAGSPPCPCCVATSWPNDVRVWVLKEYRFIVFSTGKWLQGENDTEFLSAKVSYRFLESITAQKKSLNRAGWKHCSKPFKVSALPVPLLWHTALFEECNWWMHWCDAALVMLAPYKSHVEKRTAPRETSPSKIHNQHA